jgi:PelA/Pel-15E family pectate lyase
MQWTDQTDPWHYAATFDNRSTTEQLGLLAKVHQATNDPKYSAAFLKGLDYILKAQYPNGGWPQVYPLEGAYHDEVTFNDDAMIHVMELLRGVANGQPQFAFIDDARRAKARDALAAGVRFILQAQYVQDGRRTVWGAQHDPLSLIPAAARRMEPASLSGGESVGIVRFLMDIPNPSPEVVRSIEDALAWFEKSKITGIQETKRDGRLYYAHGTTGTEPYWARFYDMQTNKPLFAGGRDAVVYANYDEMWANNPANYDFYTDKPEKLLTKDQEKWRKTLAKAGKDKAPG